MVNVAQHVTAMANHESRVSKENNNDQRGTTSTRYRELLTDSTGDWQTSILRVSECLRPALLVRRTTWHILLQPILKRCFSTSTFRSTGPCSKRHDEHSKRSDGWWQDAVARDVPALFSFLFSFFRIIQYPLHVGFVERQSNPLHVSGSADYTAVCPPWPTPPAPSPASPSGQVYKALFCSAQNDSENRIECPEVRGFKSKCDPPPPCFLLLMPLY